MHTFPISAILSSLFLVSDQKPPIKDWWVFGVVLEDIRLESLRNQRDCNLWILPWEIQRVSMLLLWAHVQRTFTFIAEIFIMDIWGEVGMHLAWKEVWRLVIPKLKGAFKWKPVFWKIIKWQENCLHVWAVTIISSFLKVNLSYFYYLVISKHLYLVRKYSYRVFL